MSQQIFTVIGAKCFAGEIEGKHYDMSKFIVLVPQYASDGSAVGSSSYELRWRDSAYYNSHLRNRQYPFKAKITTEQALQGKRFVPIITAVEIIDEKA